MNTIQKNDKLPMGLTVLSNALPPVGFYLYYRFRKAFPKKARTALINAILGIPIGLIGGYVLQIYVLN
ncbi:hypothetical protein FMM05_00510 [Flavobacterium zepuense]|uniref:Uncharacterized protein n=1 Tax=Flavobacterium zepuense TaxID=2593302 RepID=A0A552V9L8_9FLAO|nr:hypothetical protein [Flavobacterium zepuense]TRW27163.1 hypothetical protein FMM05_00510 [Flavobacterium zepuense]